MHIERFPPSRFAEGMDLYRAAFFDGALLKFLSPREDERSNFITCMFETRLRHALNCMEIYGAFEGGKLLGMATWVPPDTEFSLEIFNKYGAEESFARMTEAERERDLAFIAFMSALDQKYNPHPCWKLAPIAVLPEAQGMGVGRALMDSKLPEIGKAGLPCFLNTEDEKNVAFYKRFGFEVIGEDDILNSGTINYAMGMFP